ncbi:hypothetical protein BCF74_1229 [Knoellia remsis]|uniref:Alpha-1,6-mannosyltransferase n=1 Tax=Knoellia remsis TaxID=407159 RepID=A0A2T0UCF9_9MICO|nr:hypothetical protein [Knoellia remsis]PRY55625.1 hypothetical protein BCF74_1229 [Knoellia remsis]
MSRVASDATPGADRATGEAATLTRRGLLTVAFVLLLVVGLALPHAAAPDLGPRGWAPGTILPITLTPAAVTATLWTAYALGAAGVVLALRQGMRALSTPVVGGLALAAALTTPFGSADHVNYAAYGRILALGDDPWLVSPVSWRGDADPVVSAVESPWREEPSVYGPFATLLHGLGSLVGGDNLRETVWLWQLVVIASWLAVRWCLRRLLPGHEGRVDALWTANPLVFATGVLGAHVDMLAAAFVVGAVWAVQRYAGVGGAVLAGTFGGLALSSKFTYAVVLLAILLALRSRRVARGAVMIGVAALVAGVLHLWAGPHVFDQVGRSAKAVALSSPWRMLLEVGGGGPTVRSVISVLAALAAVGFAVCLARLTTPRGDGEGARALRWVVVLGGGYALAAAYSLPWYDVLVWSALPAVVSGVGVARVGLVELALLARLTVMSFAYTPGRVLGMTPGVEAVTMTVRKEVAPVLLLAVWAGVVVAALRARPRAPGVPNRPIG